MKTNLTFSIILFLTLRIASAQNIELGVKLGGILSIPTGWDSDYHLGMGIQDEEIYPNGASFSYSFGGLVRFPLGKSFTITTEVLFSDRNLKYEYFLRSGYYPSYTRKDIKLTKIELPVLLGFRIFQPLSVYAGPSFGILSTDEEDVSSSEIAINIGAQYTFQNNFFVDIRWSIGLTNLYSGDGIGYLDLNPYLRSEAVFFTAGYLFKL